MTIILLLIIVMLLMTRLVPNAGIAGIASRLGEILYLAGCALATVWLAIGVAILLSEVASYKEQMYYSLLGSLFWPVVAWLAIAGLIWAFGVAILYILNGSVTLNIQPSLAPGKLWHLAKVATPNFIAFAVWSFLVGTAVTLGKDWWSYWDPAWSALPYLIIIAVIMSVLVPIANELMEAWKRRSTASRPASPQGAHARTPPEFLAELERLKKQQSKKPNEQQGGHS